MNLFEGLEKFGLQQLDTKDLFTEQQEAVPKDSTANVPSEEGAERGEEDFLLKRSVRCPVCEKTFFALCVKSGRLRRMESDFDLRPRFQNIDTNKYDVVSCPMCGYTALHRYFPQITAGQIRLVKEGVCSCFQQSKKGQQLSFYTAEEAVEMYKLALYNAVVKRGKTSEKAYICLKLSWVYRGWLEEMEAEGISDEELLATRRQEEIVYYEQAFEGLMKAAATESFPLCGMEESTFNLLVANMAFRLDKIDVASKLVSGILISRMASAKVKDRARDLKEKIIEKIHKGSI